MNSENLLTLENITKTFPGVKALDNAKLNIKKGTVHGLMGENGAGKSTLMKIIIGVLKPDSGNIEFKGKSLKIKNPAEALNIGISMIHQELSPIPEMTVAENIFLGREPTKFGLVDESKLYENTYELLKKLEINLDPYKKMRELTTAYMQMVEIAKSISYNSDLIIMDEPTSAITEKEVGQLFKIIRKLKKSGVSIIYISHKMDEIFDITDECTIFRDGRFIGTELSEKLTTDDLISMMVGRKVNKIFPKEEHNDFGDVILEVKNLSCKGKFENVSFKIKKGEILGFAGLMGAGRSEVMETIFGITPKTGGEVYIHGKLVDIKKPKDAIDLGIGFLTEDRKGTGLFLPLSVADNTILSDLKNYDNSLKLIDEVKVTKICEEQRKRLRIKTPSIHQQVGNLSGGNQQKVLLARWLLMDPDILIIDEPTRGIDVGAKSEIHKIMSDLSKTGKAIIMVSSELPEIIGMSDRVMVMHEGHLSGELERKEVTQEKIMAYASK